MNESELKQYLLTHYPKENESCEWKEYKNLKHSFAGASGNDMISYVSAIANMNGGSLVIGVEDNTLNIVGITEFNNHTVQNIKLRILEKCSNLDSENLSIEEFKTSDTNKIVWVVHIPKHLPRLPVYAHSKAWQRVEDSLVEIRRERKETILKEPILFSDDWSAKILPNATIHDLDKNAIAKARFEFKIKNPNKATDCDSWDDITFLNKAKVTINGKITNTAILLLGLEESSYLLNPSVAKISWILKDKNNIEIDYKHFGIPFILNTEAVLGKIRNLTYRYMADDTLFPTEITMYDTYVIREALHNCIAHQDYSKQGRVSVVEKPSELIFTNLGHFLPESIEKVIEQDAPQAYYRNAFLAEAMVNLNMIDTIGSGIKKMFLKQRNRFFPMPDYDLSNTEQVVVCIIGRIWDINYTRMLMKKTDLDLKTVILLDKVQKSLPISVEEFQYLKRLKLIEGRRPNVHLSAMIADKSGLQAEYIKHKGIDDVYCQKIITDYLITFKTGRKDDFEKILLDKLPDVLDIKQKKNKIKNMLQSLKIQGIIYPVGKIWKMSKP